MGDIHVGVHKNMCSVCECDVVPALVCSRVWWDVSQRHTHCNGKTCMLLQEI